MKSQGLTPTCFVAPFQNFTVNVSISCYVESPHLSFASLGTSTTSTSPTNHPTSVIASPPSSPLDYIFTALVRSLKLMFVLVLLCYEIRGMHIACVPPLKRKSVRPKKTWWGIVTLEVIVEVIVTHRMQTAKFTQVPGST